MTQNSGIPYQSDAELMAMKDNLADRKFRLKIIGAAVTGLFLVGSVAAMFAFPQLLAGGATIKSIVSLGLLAATGATSFLTLKEVKKIEIDEKFLSSYMQGKNHWGHGYRQEVAEQGYGFGRDPHDATPTAPQFPKAILTESGPAPKGRSGGFGF